MNYAKFRFKIVTNSHDTNTSIITTDFVNSSMTENKYVIPLIALLNHKNYNVMKDFYGTIDFEDGSNGVHYKMSFPRLILEKNVKKINVQNFPFDTWKIKIVQIKSNHGKYKPFIHNTIYNPEIKNGIIYKPDDIDDITGFIELYMVKNDIEEKEFDNRSDIKEYTDYIYYFLDKYNSGIRKLYDWVASLE